MSATGAGMGRHAGGGGAAASGPSVPETTYAERARTLVHLERIGSLSTHSRKQPGYPFGSLMPYGLDERGRPIFLISTMAMHTQNLQADARASLLVAQSGGGDPLGASRVTLVGEARPVPEAETADARELYLARYAYSRNWVDYEDFSFYRLEIADVYYVGGFGVMGWVAAEDYLGAQPDPLAEHAEQILGHMNGHHAEALARMARKFAGIESEEATMTAVDRLGFQMRLVTREGPRGTRIAFLREARSAEEARAVLVEMSAQARQG